MKPLLPWKINEYYIFFGLCVYVPARVRVCVYTRVSNFMWWWVGSVRARGRVHVCARARLAVFIQHGTLMRLTTLSFVASVPRLYFSTLSHKLHDFRKNVFKYRMCFPPYKFHLKHLSF